MSDTRTCSRRVSVTGVWGGRRCGRPAIEGSDLCKPHDAGRKRAEDNRIKRDQNWDAEKAENARRRQLFADFIAALDAFEALDANSIVGIKRTYGPVRDFLRVALSHGVDGPGPRPQGGGGAAPA